VRAFHLESEGAGRGAGLLRGDSGRAVGVSGGLLRAAVGLLPSGAAVKGGGAYPALAAARGGRFVRRAAGFGTPARLLQRGRDVRAFHLEGEGAGRGAGLLRGDSGRAARVSGDLLRAAVGLLPSCAAVEGGGAYRSAAPRPDARKNAPPAIALRFPLRLGQSAGPAPNQLGIRVLRTAAANQRLRGPARLRCIFRTNAPRWPHRAAARHAPPPGAWVATSHHLVRRFHERPRSPARSR